MSDILYIVGNGFDRYHGLDTRYQNFAFFLQENYPDMHQDLVVYYGLPDLDQEDPESVWDPLWAEFEKALAELDFQAVLDDNRDLAANPSNENFRDRDWHTYQIEMEMVVNRLTYDLCEAFREFILSVRFSDDYQSKVLEIDRNAIFLSFNYTKTMEQYYGVRHNNILYIHGYAQNNDERIILGHAKDPSSFKPEEKQPPLGLNEEDMENWIEEASDSYDYSYEQAQFEILTYFERSHKFTQEIINQNSNFFDDLKGVKKIVVLGHSLADVDQPYFRKIIASVPDNTLWIVTYHFDKDKVAHLETLKQLGLNENQIELVIMDDIKPKQPELF